MVYIHIDFFVGKEMQRTNQQNLMCLRYYGDNIFCVYFQYFSFIKIFFMFVLCSETEKNDKIQLQSWVSLRFTAANGSTGEE